MLIMVVMLRGHTWGTRPYRQLRSRAAALWQFGGLKTVAVKIAVNSHDVSRVDTARIHKASAASSYPPVGVMITESPSWRRETSWKTTLASARSKGRSQNLIDHKDKRRKLGVAG